jgi:nicotinate-nucleotide adenylyltransferase
MRLAIFGGTFDPVHSGHLLMAESAREQAKLDRVIFLPTGAPPHKPAPLASTKHRLAMLRKATVSNPAFKVSDWEIRQRGTVYTFQALAHFKSAYPKATLFFILGSDALRDLPTWRQGTDLLKQARFLVIDREEAPWMSLSETLRARVARVQSPVCGVSSHALRVRAAKGQSLRYCVPDSVAAYIRSARVYARGRA